MPESPRTPGPSPVVYMANAAKIGGGAKVLMDLVLRLDPSRFRPVLVAPDSGPLTEWADARSIPCFISAEGDWFSRFHLTRRVAQLVGILSRTRPAIVHAAAPMCYRALGVAARAVGAKRICHLGFPPEPGELERAFITAPEVVIGCYEGQARAHAEEISRLSPGSRVLGIPNGIDVDRFSPDPPPGEDCERWRFGARHMVAILGHLSEVKGHPTFLEAAAEVVRDIPDCAFVAIGGESAQPGFKRVLEARASVLGLADRLHFVGFQDHVAPLLRAADVVTLPSLAEGFPLAILEAMACGKPVIATGVGGVAEAIQHRESGWLISPRDSKGLADAIKTLLGAPLEAARLGQAARARAVSEFSIERFATRVQELYRDLLHEA